MLVSRILAALPDAALGLAFLITWFAPYTFGDAMLKYATLMMLLEFIVIHSAAFMGFVLWTDMSVVKRILLVLGFGVMYSTFVVGFAMAMDQWWPLWAFWVLIGNRLTNALFHRGPLSKARSQMVVEWGLSVVWYLIWVFGTTLLWVPRFGITPEVVAAAQLPGGGLWVDEPYRVIAAGAGYFLCQVWTELTGGKLITLSE